MAQLWSAFIPQTAPGDVWARLPVEEQTRVVRLLAHLAYHVVTTDSPLPSRREMHDAATDHSQTPA
jgi:hypothetical protein